MAVRDGPAANDVRPTLCVDTACLEESVSGG